MHQLFIRFFLGTLFFFMILSSKSQIINNGIIKGSIINEQNKPVPHITILLKPGKDSTGYKTQISDDAGAFSFNTLQTGTYSIEITSVNFEKISLANIKITKDTSIVNAGVILLKIQQHILTDVTVKNQRPFIERKIDKTVVNIENSIINAGTTALEMMRKLPGVQITETGQITLNGKSAVNVFIDGKATLLSQEDLTNLLRSTPSENIQKVEIMTNPSAKYDAAGSGGIINIVKKKNKKEGLSGSVNGNYTQSNYGSYNSGFTLGFKNKKYNLFFTNAYVYDKTLFNRDVTNEIFNPDSSLKAEQSSNTNTVSTDKAYTPSLGIDLYLSKKTTLSLSGSFKTASSNNTINAWMDNFDNNKTKISTGTFLGSNNDKLVNYATGIHLDQQLDTSGKNLIIDLDYVDYKNTPTQAITSTLYDTTGNFTSRSNTLLNGNRRLNIYVAKADYSQPIMKNARLEIGWKSSFVKSDNNYIFYNKVGGQNLIDSSQSDHSVNKENINAAYLNINAEYKKWTLQTGLRAEHTWSEGEQLFSGLSVKQNYVRLFPSVFLDYKINDRHGLNIKIGKRTDRAAYGEMIPFRRALSPTLYFMGNPNLRPQFSYHGEIMYAYQNALFITFGYDIYHDYIRTIPFLDSNLTTVTRVPSNIQGAHSWNIDISYSKQLTTWWTTNNSLSFYQKAFKGALNGFSLNNKGMVSVYLNSENSFTITNKLSAECSFEYSTKRQLINSTYGGYNVLSFGVKQQVFKNKGAFVLNLNNVLQGEDRSVTDKYNDLNQYSYWRFYSRSISLTFTYRFGTGKAIKSAAGSGASEEQKRSN